MCKLVSMNTNCNTQVQVADIKKEYLENMIAEASRCEHIQEIILFGSVLEERCTDLSDIDIVVVSDLVRSKLYRVKSYVQFLDSLHKKDDYAQHYDVICVNGREQLMRNIDKVRLYGNVIRHGQTIYKKGML